LPVKIQKRIPKLPTIRTPVQQSQEISDNIVKLELVVDGMTCTGCENTIKANVSSLEGVNHVEASHVKGITVVDFDPEVADTAAIKLKIIESGYTVVASNAMN
jgi:copper chaperone CopZ